MVYNVRNAGRDETFRTDKYAIQIELGQVERVWTHFEKDDKNWQVQCDYLIHDTIPVIPQECGPDGPARRFRVPVAQRDSGNCTGEYFRPRVGDIVLVVFYKNEMPIIVGTLNQQFSHPSCYDSAWSMGNEEGHYEYNGPDFIGGYYDHRTKWTQWLHVERKTITDTWNQTWFTWFYKHPDGQGKLRPVCSYYRDRTKDFSFCFECKAGKEDPSCEKCIAAKMGIDWIKDEEDTSDYEAANTWLKFCSSDYLGKNDFPRRTKYHHNCGSLFCFDSRWPDGKAAPGAGKVWTKNEDFRGRIWLESQEGHRPCGHLHFRGFKNQDFESYPETPEQYGPFNISIRSMQDRAAHIELWGKNKLQGRIDIANEFIGKVKPDAIHYSDIDAHATITEKGDIHIHAVGEDGQIFEVASKEVIIESGEAKIHVHRDDVVEIIAGTANIHVHKDGEIEITSPTKPVKINTPLVKISQDLEVGGNVSIDGTLQHTLCVSCSPPSDFG